MTLFTAQLDPQLSQGDLFAADWDNDRTPHRGSVIVLSEGCDIEHSPETVLVAVAEDEGASDPTFVSNVKKGKVFWAFALEGMGRWANLRTTYPESKVALQAKLSSRLCSMTENGRVALATKYFSFLTHSKPPKCKYFRDDVGVVWDVWAVDEKDHLRLEDQFKKKLNASLVGGWLCFSSSKGTFRLVGFPEAWQFLPDVELTKLLRQSTEASSKDGLALAAEAAARQRANASEA